MDKSIPAFTIHEAIEHYKGNPKVQCLADDSVLQINSATLHATSEGEWPELWIWAYGLEDDHVLTSILLYAPSKLDTSKYVRAKIIDQ